MLPLIGGGGTMHNIVSWLRTTGLERVTYKRNLKNILLKSQGLLSQCDNVSYLIRAVCVTSLNI